MVNVLDRLILINILEIEKDGSVLFIFKEDVQNDVALEKIVKLLDGFYSQVSQSVYNTKSQHMVPKRFWIELQNGQKQFDEQRLSETAYELICEYTDDLANSLIPIDVMYHIDPAQIHSTIKLGHINIRSVHTNHTLEFYLDFILRSKEELKGKFVKDEFTSIKEARNFYQYTIKREPLLRHLYNPFVGQ